MPQITYVQPDGARRSVPVQPNASVMLTAVANDIGGIVAECGGAAMCATCHVYLDDASVSAMPPVSEVEDEMLASAASERRPTSRLSCQLTMPAGLDELVVHVPSHQV